jgi:hypothetical protein
MLWSWGILARLTRCDIGYLVMRGLLITLQRTFDSVLVGNCASTLVLRFSRASGPAQLWNQPVRPLNESYKQVVNMHYYFSDYEVGKWTSDITRLTLYVSTMAFGGRYPSLKTSEPGMFVQTQILSSRRFLEG